MISVHFFDFILDLRLKAFDRKKEKKLIVFCNDVTFFSPLSPTFNLLLSPFASSSIFLKGIQFLFIATTSILF